MDQELSGTALTLIVVPLCGLLASNITIYLKTRSDNTLALKTLEETRKADREDAAQKRAWDIEDRARSSELIHAAIVASGAKADAAYSEANGTNLKIATLQRLQAQANEVISRQNIVAGDTAASTLARIEVTGEKTGEAIVKHDAWERERAEVNDARDAVPAPGVTGAVRP